MGLIGSNFAADGATRMWRGMREGDQKGLLLGAAMLAFAWWRRSQGEQRTLLRRVDLKEGENIIIRSGNSGPRQVDLT